MVEQQPLSSHLGWDKFKGDEMEWLFCHRLLGWVAATLATFSISLTYTPHSRLRQWPPSEARQYALSSKELHRVRHTHTNRCASEQQPERVEQLGPRNA